LFEDARPTCTVLAPQLLGLWVQQLLGAGRRAPERLRFVAVGGAPTPPALIEAAWAVGIPVYEGYGLSECCSVVTLNRPGALKKGSVGHPLPGLKVFIDEGEIVVEGPSVMEGYLGGPNLSGTWRTGDLGSLDEAGYLTIFGRKDNLIVTSLGRNVSPEWIETMLLADRRIGLCMVFGHGEPRLRALIVPSAAGAAWFAKTVRDERLALISRCCDGAPSYAVPQEVVVMPLHEIARLGLVTANGRFRRKEAAAFFKDSQETVV
jgi:long-subunit acyl-CoA synthetase (AMP-forming)